LSDYDYGLLKKVQKNVFVSSMVEIRRPHLVELGSYVAIDTGFYLTTQALIGSFVHIGPYVTCIGGERAKLVMEDFTTVAAGARLICAGDEYLGFGLVGPTIPLEFRDNSVGGQITIEEYASVGTNAIIFPGITVGEGSVIGAGSVLTQDSKPWTIYDGNPARPLRPRLSTKMKSFGEILRIKLNN
jgi:acetyltransferase-like isoleucine patch superfamily enzyme